MDGNVIGPILSAVIGGTVVAFVSAVVFLRRAETIRNEVRSRYSWLETSVSDLLGPLAFELDRSHRAFGRWEDANSYVETEIIRAVNLRARDLLLGHAYLIPSDLWVDAEHLIEHFDRWLEEYEDKRVRRKEVGGFVFAGPAGFPFPTDAELRFRAYFEATWKQLYGADQARAAIPRLPARSPDRPTDRTGEVT